MTAHEKRIQKIETECVELRKQILQLEFQHKKDIREFEKHSQVQTEKYDREWERTKKHLRHLSQLAGIAFERLEELDERLESASISLSHKGKKSI